MTESRWLWAALFALLAPSATAVPTDQIAISGRNNGHHDRLPAVFPTPQQYTSLSGGVALKGQVTIVTGNATDSATIDAVKAIVSSAGGHVSVSPHPSGKGTQILLGTNGQNAAASAAAKALTGETTDGLAADGYVLASGTYNRQPTIVLNGVDERGTFYAAQTLRQLVDGNKREIPGVKVRDWPLMSIRGSIEGFYGTPWSHQARLDQFAFYGKHKLNTYIYTPKDDVLLRAQWRTLYSTEAVAQLKQLIDTANANHVDFTFALSPANDLCYTSDDDFAATVAKFEQIRALGVHSFYIALDDIPLTFHCDSDKQKYPNEGNWHWIADAQADYLNRIQTEYIEPKGLDDLQTVPTNYAGSKPDPYKEEFGTKLNKKVRVQWTGEGVFSDKITMDSVTQAASTYVTDNLYIWDNFPVNDGARDRLFLNPLDGRAAELYKHIIGFTSNPMIEPYASMPALANFGDYTWNGPTYNPATSMEAALWELAGSDNKVHDAVVAFADLNQNWPYRDPTVNATLLSNDIASFWASRKSKGKGNGGKALQKRLDLIASLPKVLPRMAMKGFATDVAPWATVAMQWANACQHLIAMLDAHDHGNKAKADREYAAAQQWIEKTKAKTVGDTDDKGQSVPNSITPRTGDGVFDAFAANATVIYKS